jgi:hypothetical protein
MSKEQSLTKMNGYVRKNAGIERPEQPEPRLPQPEQPVPQPPKPEMPGGPNEPHVPPPAPEPLPTPVPGPRDPELPR